MKTESVDKIRLSIGTAIQIGLEKGKPDPMFSTAFLMTYNETGCTANCAFCPQAMGSSSPPHLLSRIGWPVYEFHKFLSNLGDSDSLRRVCIQCLNYEGVVEDVANITQDVKELVNLPISVCIHPIDREAMTLLHDSGVQRIGIAFDACTESLFDRIKGKDRGANYTWEKHMFAIDKALDVFGEGRVTTHLIVGLGESEKEAVEFLYAMKDRGVHVGLFAFTSVDGTAMEKERSPKLGKYRRIQIIRHLLSKSNLDKSIIYYTSDGEVRLKMNYDELIPLLDGGISFRVTGCPGCNRPYYNERPSGPMYNYPRDLDEEQFLRGIKESKILNEG